jgi:hypothetical protein
MSKNISESLLQEFDLHMANIGIDLRLNDVPVPAIYGPPADEAVAR